LVPPVLYVIDVLLPYVAGAVLVAAFFLGALIVAPNDQTLRFLLTENRGLIALVIPTTLISCFALGQHLVSRLERAAEADPPSDYGTRYLLAKEFLSFAGNPYFTLNYVLLLSLLWLSVGPVGLGKEVQLGCAKVAFLYELARIIALYGGYCLYVHYSDRLPHTYSTDAAEWSVEKRIYPLHFDDVSSEFRRLGWVLVGACGGTAILLLEIIKRC